MAYYTDEKNAQIIIALLKKNNIKKIIASPGTTNMAFVASVQNDSFFEVYSSVDERSAAYIACGMAAETGEVVVISCTGATASRNYLPALTEAYYRKLPILAITSTQMYSKMGHHSPQAIDRTRMPKDAIKHSVELPIVKDNDSFWDCEVKVNKVMHELKRMGGGPVHINLPTSYSTNYTITSLPEVRNIKHIGKNSEFPTIPQGKIAIFVGSHKKMTDKEISAIDNFCKTHNGVVLCDHTSNYNGQYRILSALVGVQTNYNNKELKPDLLIHIGEVSGDYYTPKYIGENVWRVNEDGELRDTFKRLTHVFEMSESDFFLHYITDTSSGNSYLQAWQEQLNSTRSKFPADIPFSNIWLASKLHNKLPRNSTIHFAILNSLRSWNLFELDKTITSSSNVGGFGIDGCVSTLIGASLCNPQKLYFGIIGDLAFFYDLNSIGNRHVSKNLRLLVVNNGVGTEFKNFNHNAHLLKENANDFVAAAGHFGKKSKTLLKGYAEALGFEYLSASDKDEFGKVQKQFLNDKITDRPMLLEVFTDDEDESKALEIIMNIEEAIDIVSKGKVVVKKVFGQKGVDVVKNILGK